MTEKSGKFWSARAPLMIGFISLGLLIGGIGVWSTTAEIAGAVIASGTVQVEANRQVVQHPEGGVVGGINVKDGDVVQAGDVLVAFDDTQLMSELAIIESQYFELLARKALFKAERDGRDALTYHPELMEEAETHREIRALMQGQTNFFHARRTSLNNQREQLTEQKGQIGQQIDGIVAQKTANQSQLDLLKEELKTAQSLLDKGLAQASRVMALRREEARIAGEIGRLMAEEGRLKAAINSINIQLEQLNTDRRESAIENLRDVSYRVLELVEQRASILQTLSRLNVRAPMAGTVHENRVFALQSVIQPAEPMMYIIPDDLPLVVQGRVDTVHVDQVYVGQEVALNFVAFSQRTTPQLFGTVTKLSADVLTDAVTGFKYYQVEITPNPGELDKLEEVELISGMPVDAFLKTENRTALTYLTKPLTDYFNKAFREE